jgi:hypothetical protein
MCQETADEWAVGSGRERSTTDCSVSLPAARESHINGRQALVVLSLSGQERQAGAGRAGGNIYGSSLCW